jgi:hypothetical protein
MGPLWEATRDLHHEAEGHPVAVRMVDGTITPQEWADWLHAHWVIQMAIDPHLPENLRRAPPLAADLMQLLPVLPHPSSCAEKYAETLNNVVDIFGAAYLLIGAHRRGGQVIERAMWKHGVQLPAGHIVFEDPKAAERFVKVLRDKVELAHGARRAFGVLYEVMNEIEARRTQ